MKIRLPLTLSILFAALVRILIRQYSGNDSGLEYEGVLSSSIQQEIASSPEASQRDFSVGTEPVDMASSSPGADEARLQVHGQATKQNQAGAWSTFADRLASAKAGNAHEACLLRRDIQRCQSMKLFADSEKGIGALVHAESETELARAEQLIFGDTFTKTQEFCAGFESSMSEKRIELELLRVAASDDRYSTQIDAVLRLPTGISPQQRSDTLARWSNRNDPRAAWYLVKRSLSSDGESGLGRVSDRDLYRALRLSQLSFDDWQDSDRIASLQSSLVTRLGLANVLALNVEVGAAVPPRDVSIYPRDSRLLVHIPTPGITKCECLDEQDTFA